MKKIILLAIFAVSIFSLKAQSVDVIDGTSDGPSTSGSITQATLLLKSAGTFGMSFGTYDNTSQYGWIQAHYTDAAGTTRPLVLNPIGGNVGIGTTSPDSLLTVNGFIHAKGVTIDLNGPLADFVFNKDYKLMPLNKVADYVKDNNHLPDMPSAKEVAKKGLSMGEMQNKLLQKVEELTLYMIQQQKTIEQQNVKIAELEKKIK